MQPLQPKATLQNGKYTIKKVLGQGGFGITYLAEQEMLDRQVAIKEFFFKEYCGRDEQTCHVTLGTQSNKETVDRFLQKFIKEAKTISKLHHPGIIEIYDIFMENNTAYYVMEYIEGESLGDIVKSRGALPEKEALRYIRETAEALDYIHSRNINHLDIKPNNLMLRSRDSKIVVIDFGVSKQYDENTNESTTTTPVGISHGYSPVEQYKKNGVSSFSPQSDIYSLGATLYKLITGVTPPEAIEVAQGGLPPMGSTISENVKQVILDSMQFQKANRPQTIAAFVGILDRSANVVSNVAHTSVNNIDEDETTQLVEHHQEKPQRKIPVIEPLPTNHSDFANEEKGSSSTLGKIGLGCFVIVIIGLVLCLVAYRLGKDIVEDSSSDQQKVISVEQQPEKVSNFEIKLQDGSTAYFWTGELVNGLPQGNGQIKYADNDKDGRYIYEGSVEQGVRNDKNATLQYRNGNSYTGSFENDNFKLGRLVLKNDGMYFSGSFKDNQPWNGNWYFIQDNSWYSIVAEGKEILRPAGRTRA